MAQVVKDLIRGTSDPSTLGTYTTKGFNNEGVKNSEPVDRLNENGVKGITPDVMKNTTPVTKIVKDGVSVKSAGTGVSEDAGNVRKSSIGAGTKSAGHIGGSNVSHV